MLEVKRFVLQPVSVNTYVAFDTKTKEGVIVDPGENISDIFKEIKNVGANIKYIIATHIHFDHVAGIFKAKKNYPDAEVVCPADSKDFITDPLKNASHSFFEFEAFTADRFVSDMDSLELGEEKFEVLLIPGHTDHHIALIHPKAIFAGDLIFKQGVGRTDLYSGDYGQLQESISKIIGLARKKKSMMIYPGHDEPFSLIEKFSIFC